MHTIDGRETAPRKMPHDAFIDPKTGKPYNFTPELVTSGVSVGVPGTPATWAKALRSWGTYRFKQALAPAADLAERGFKVDKTFNQQTADNQQRFEAYTTTPRLFLPHGKPPAVGSVLKNPSLARTYRTLGRKGVSWFYHGPIARQIAYNVQHPPKSPSTDLPVPKGFMEAGDLARYRALFRKPTYAKYRGYGVWGMGGSSSGGTTVGEALNIMEQFPLRRMTTAQRLHVYLESSALAFADRAKYLGDPAYVSVPRSTLLSDRYAASRACKIDLKQGDDQADHRRRRAQLRPDLRPVVVRDGEQAGRHRERRDDQPHRDRQVGQRRGVHPHHRADRRLRDAAEGPRLPAQQRAHRLLGDLRPEATPTASTRASARARRSRRRSSCATGSRSSRWAHRAARRSSRPCCR